MTNPKDSGGTGGELLITGHDMLTQAVAELSDANKRIAELEADASYSAVRDMEKDALIGALRERIAELEAENELLRELGVPKPVTQDLLDRIKDLVGDVE